MREKLVELIAGTKYGKDLSTTVGANFQRSFIERIADHLIANGVTVQRWIPVGERLPEVEGSYLVCSKTDKVYRAHWYPEKKYHEGYTRKAKWSHPNVTHWMPLPDAPKEVE